MTSQNAIKVQHVSKNIGGNDLIKDLSFSIQRGEICGLLGPNGAGKTLTIRMMVGLISITEGDIFIEGHSVRTQRTNALRHIGAIVENPDLYSYMTGIQNLKHFARMYKQPITKERMMEVAELVELTDAIHNKVKTYSLGMRQRLGIAQALLHKPSVLILDEPTNGLDPAGIHQLRNYLYQLAKKENIAVIISSHLLSEIELMCDRVVIIQNGVFVGEHNIKAAKEANTQVEMEVEFEITEPVRAATLLTNIPIIRTTERTITVSTTKQHIPELVATLVQNGIGVFQVQIKTKSLEETFLSITGGTHPS
ncbi:ABC transporter ATP-binding protein [Aneurinibacillus aneurinilyticus]|uniref:ABC transporter ATP-binding protein n=1 Tax=Aneurinibacillus aneurinilyticus TaxID=1391 RepID=UPI002E1F657E|nr:ABC transporter ATP-binding protein [Aneurinibacillus aneurinilyticus]